MNYGTLINGIMTPAPRQKWRGFVFPRKNPLFPPCRNITDLIYYQRT